MKMTKEKKSKSAGQYSVALEKELRLPLLKALTAEMENTGEYKSITCIASQLIRIGLKQKYPDALR